MLPSALPPDPIPVADYRGARARCLRSALAGCSLLKLGYGAGQPARLSLARPLRRLRRRAVAARAHRARRGAGLASAHASCPTTSSCSCAPRRRSPATSTPERMCAWGREFAQRGSTPLDAVRAPTDRRGRADAVAGAAAAHREALCRDQRASGATSICSAIRETPPPGRRCKREVERAETLYGELDDGQRELGRARGRRVALRRRARATPSGWQRQQDVLRAGAPSARDGHGARRRRRAGARLPAAPRALAARGYRHQTERLRRLQLRATRARCTTRPARRSGAPRRRS